MNLDTETEEGRANWARFNTLSIAILYQYGGMVSGAVLEAARLLLISDETAVAQMTETIRNKGIRLRRAVEPFIPKRGPNNIT